MIYGRVDNIINKYINLHIIVLLYLYSGSKLHLLIIICTVVLKTVLFHLLVYDMYLFIYRVSNPGQGRRGSGAYCAFGVYSWFWCGFLTERSLLRKQKLSVSVSKLNSAVLFFTTTHDSEWFLAFIQWKMSSFCALPFPLMRKTFYFSHSILLDQWCRVTYKKLYS